MGTLHNHPTSKMDNYSATGYDEIIHANGGGGGGGRMETRLAVLEAEVSHIRSNIYELKDKASTIDATVNSVNKDMAIVLERLENIKESLAKKPSSDAIDKKISESKLAILLGVPAIIAIGTAIYKAIQHYI